MQVIVCRTPGSHRALRAAAGHFGHNHGLAFLHCRRLRSRIRAWCRSIATDGQRCKLRHSIRRHEGRGQRKFFRHEAGSHVLRGLVGLGRHGILEVVRLEHGDASL